MLGLGLGPACIGLAFVFGSPDVFVEDDDCGKIFATDEVEQEEVIGIEENNNGDKLKLFLLSTSGVVDRSSLVTSNCCKINYIKNSYLYGYL